MVGLGYDAHAMDHNIDRSFLLSLQPVFEEVL